MKKKELTLQDIFNQNNELYKNIIDCFTKLEAKIDNVKGEYYGGETIDLTNIHAALAKHFGTTDKDYITITADDVLVGGESVREYNGEKIYNYYHLPAYFKEIRDDVAEKGIKLLEIHCLQSSTDGEYAKTGNPTPDKNGCSAWCRCVWEKDGENILGAGSSATRSVRPPIVRPAVLTTARTTSVIPRRFGLRCLVGSIDKA